MRRFLTRSLSLGILGVCALLAVVAAHAFTHDAPKPAYRQEAVKRGSFTPVVIANGTLEPEEVVEVGAQVGGMLKRFGPDPNNKNKMIEWNSVVKKGDVLAEIDPTLYERQLNKAKVDLRAAEAILQQEKVRADVADRALGRAKKREADKTAGADEVAVAQDALDLAQAAVPVAEARLAQSKADVDQAKINLDYTIVRAPVDGIVIDRRVNVGQMMVASLSAPSLFVLATPDLKKLQVWALVKEMESGKVKEGQAVTFTVEAYRLEVFKGRIASIRLNAPERPLDKPTPVTFTAVVEVDNSNLKLLPYLSAAVSIPVAECKNVLLVPNAALRWRPRLKQLPGADPLEYLRWTLDPSTMVWVQEDGELRRIPVKVGMSDGRVTEILSGDLKEGAKVITGTVGEPEEQAK